MKRKPSDLSPEEQAQTRKLLFAAAQTAFDNKNIEEFLECLLTPSEQIMLGRRIWIARMLLEKKRYDEIGAQLNVGPSTIRKVELWLLGLIPDYGKHIKSQRKKMAETRRKEIAKQNPFGLTALKKKYPLHFLLFPWPKV